MENNTITSRNTTDIKTFNPITPSLRQRVMIRSNNLHKGSSDKSLTVGSSSSGGRNMHGRITVYHRGGGHKRNYRIIDFERQIGAYSTARVLRIEYDPNRSANIALCEKIITHNQVDNRGGISGGRFYIIAPKDLSAGQIINGKFSPNSNLNIGQTKPLIEFPIGSIVHNLSSQYCRSAGTKAIVLKHNPSSTLLRLPSKIIKEFPHTDLASLGIVSNPFHNNRVLGKAGASAWIGRLPRVKGVKMNPIDHPHGGKTPVSGGRGSPPRNRWGRLAKWQKQKSKRVQTV